MKSYKILQICKSDVPAFFGLDFMKEAGLSEDWYKEVWQGVYTGSENTVVGILEDLFREFNIDHPEGFTGHSLSTSDIVILEDTAYYCDSFGWKPLLGFEWNSVIQL